MRRVTNLDPKRGRKKAIWYEDTAQEAVDIYPNPDGSPRPSRYGPDREYVANCRTVEAADRFVALWNGDLDVRGTIEKLIDEIKHSPTGKFIAEELARRLERGHT